MTLTAAVVRASLDPARAHPGVYRRTGLAYSSLHSSLLLHQDSNREYLHQVDPRVVVGAVAVVVGDAAAVVVAVASFVAVVRVALEAASVSPHR